MLDKKIPIKDVIPKKKFIKKIVLFDEIKKNILSDQIIELKNILSSTLNFDENNPIINLNRKDPACIIYTSGTGGNPKGVVLSHGGILSNCEGAINLIKPILSNRTRTKAEELKKSFALRASTLLWHIQNV